MNKILNHWNSLHVNLIALKYLLNYTLDLSAVLHKKKRNHYRYHLVNRLLFELQKSSLAKRCQENNIKKGYALFRRKIPLNNQISESQMELIIHDLIVKSLKINESLKQDNDEYREVFCNKVRKYLIN